MKCPYCQADRNYVSGRGQASSDKDADYKRRRRTCLECNRVFWTREEYVPNAAADGQLRRREKLYDKSRVSGNH